MLPEGIAMKFSMSEAWRDATAMLSANREVLLIVAGIFFFIPGVAMGLAMGDIQEIMLADPENMQAIVLSFYTDWGWLIALTTIASMVGYLTLLALLRDHNRPTVGQAIKIGLVGLLPAVGAYLVFILGLSLAAALLVGLATVSGVPALGFIAILIVFVGAVYVAVKASLSGPVIAIDKVYNPFTVLLRSWRLTKGNSFRLFQFYLLLIVVYFVITAVVSGVVGLLLLAIGGSVASTANAVLSAAISAVFYLILVAVLAAVHRQLSGPSPAAVSETFE
jgi:hypothetical protein